jgi:hypothetical protein
VQAGHDGSPDGVTDAAAGRHPPSHAHGEPNHHAGMRFTLLLVGSQHGRGKVAVEHTGQFPGQVHRVAQAGPQALADKWRCEMGGVAE